MTRVYKTWTEEEIERLKKLYYELDYTAEDCSIELKRSLFSIKTKLSKLKKKKLEKS